MIDAGKPTRHSRVVLYPKEMTGRFAAAKLCRGGMGDVLVVEVICPMMIQVCALGVLLWIRVILYLPMCCLTRRRSVDIHSRVEVDQEGNRAGPCRRRK